jgi:ABC-type branched-subunit amino acid transport system substrate-binding protein
VSVRAAALVLAAAALAGCGSNPRIERGGAVVGTTLAVYSSLPDPGRGTSRDIVDGEKLALTQAGGRAGEYLVNFVSVDETGRPAREHAAATVEDTIRDLQLVAVIGGLRSETAAVSVPLYNAAGILIASPGAQDPRLDTPHYEPSGRPTLARLVGDDDAQARALLRAAGTDRVAVEREPGATGAAIAAALRRAGARVDPGARVLVYAGRDAEAAARAVARHRGPVVLPDEVVREGLRVPRAARDRVRLVTSAPAPGSTPQLRAFERDFRAAFDREPGPYAAVGYVAMNDVLATIRRAGKRANRRSVIADDFVRSTRPRPYRVIG